jgi:hypothetical protein
LSRALPLVLLGVLVASAMGTWWLYAGEKAPTLPAPPVRDDLDLVTTLLDGAAAEPPHDVLLAGADEVYLLRAGEGTVVAVAKKGGATRTLATLKEPAHGMALAAGALWVTTTHAVEAVPVAGGEARRVAGGLGGPQAIACDGTWVFVVDVDPSRQGMTPASTVVRLPAAGGDATVLGKSEGEIASVAVDDANVYWTDRLDGTLVFVPKTGGAPHVLAAERGLPGFVAVAGGAVTWVEPRSESLWTMPKGGGPPRRLAQDFAGFANVVVDARGVFWTNEAAVDGQFRVLTVGKTGDVETASDPVDAVAALASDGQRLYWERDGVVTAVVGP